MSKERRDLAIFLVGFVLFVILAALVGEAVKLEGLTRTVVGGVVGFGALANSVVFGLTHIKWWQMKKITKAEREFGWLGFFGFLGFLGNLAFRHGEPLYLFLFCLFGLFGFFGYFRKELYHLNCLGLLGVLLPTLYVLGLLAV